MDKRITNTVFRQRYKEFRNINPIHWMGVYGLSLETPAHFRLSLGFTTRRYSENSTN
jgi:hypothetical protein